MQVKPNQENLVVSILESTNYGPNTIDSMLLWNQSIEEAGRTHLEFVVEQLIVSGCLTYTSDRRLITTQQGEILLNLTTQHVA